MKGCMKRTNPTTPLEAELEQKITEFMAFVRNYAATTKASLTLKGERDKFTLFIHDNDVTLEFEI